MTTPKKPDESTEGPEPATGTETAGASDETAAVASHRRSLRQRVAHLSGRAATVAVVVAALVVALGTTIGVEVSHALSGPATPTTTTTTTAGPSATTTTEPSGSGGGGSPTTTTTAPPQSGAPTVPTPGGATKGHGAFDAVACTGPKACLAVGADTNGNGVAAVTTNGGSTWDTQPLPQGVSTLNAVTCATATHCIAVGEGAVLSTTDGGSTWTLHTPPADTTLLGVTCVTKEVCLTTGVTPDPGGPYAGVVLRSTDGGSTWGVVDMPQGTLGLGAVTCPTATRCIAVGATIMTSDDGGATWQQRAVDGGVDTLRSITCSSATHCVAVGPNSDGEFNPTAPATAVVTNDGGTTWSQLPLPAGTAALEQVTCATATECFAGGPAFGASTGATFEVTTDGGTTWTPASPPEGLSAITDLSCPAANDCVVVGRSGTQPVTASTDSAGTLGTANPANPVGTPASDTTWSVTAVPQS